MILYNISNYVCLGLFHNVQIKAPFLPTHPLQKHGSSDGLFLLPLLLLLFLFLHSSNFWMQRWHLSVSLRYRKYHGGPWVLHWVCNLVSIIFCPLPISPYLDLLCNKCTSPKCCEDGRRNKQVYLKEFHTIIFIRTKTCTFITSITSINCPSQQVTLVSQNTPDFVICRSWFVMSVSSQVRPPVHSQSLGRTAVFHTWLLSLGLAQVSSRRVSGRGERGGGVCGDTELDSSHNLVVMCTTSSAQSGHPGETDSSQSAQRDSLAKL